MTYEGLLALIAITLAVYQLADPGRRVSIDMFVNLTTLLVVAVGSFLILLAIDLAQNHMIALPRSLSPWFLRSLAFAIPTITLFNAFRTWKAARLTPANVAHLSRLIRTALLERRSDEVERVIQRNGGTLHMLPAEVLADIFDEHLIRAFLEARSMLHLDLLSRKDVLEAIKPPFEIADRLIRGLLRPGLALSPLRFEVLETLSGKGTYPYHNEEKVLFAATFGDPVWYTTTAAHGSLVLVGLEALRSGTLDERYNAISLAYEAQEGKPERATCPLYLTVTAQYTAIRSAICAGSDDDLYVTNFWVLFQHVLRRSLYRPGIWDSPAANPEHPTPYSFILYEIIHDLERLTENALERAITEHHVPMRDVIEGLEATREGRAPRWKLAERLISVSPPGRIAQQLALTWSFCVAEILLSTGKVSDRFRLGLGGSLIYFLINIAFEPRRISYDAPPVGTPNLDIWCSLYTDQLKKRLSESRRDLAEALADLLDRALDVGRSNVSEGRDWLKSELGLS